MAEPYLYRIHIPDPDFPILFHIHTCSEPRAEIVGRHWHREMEILSVLEGRMRVHAADRSFVAETGDLIVVGSNEVHGIANLEGESVHGCITVDLRFLEGNFFDACDRKYVSAIARSSVSFGEAPFRDEELCRLFRATAEEIQRGAPGYELFVKANLYAFIGRLVRERLRPSVTPGQYESRARNAARLRPALDALEARCGEEWTAERLAGMVGLGTSRFGHVFKDVTGMRPAEYLRRLRVRRAALLLGEGHGSVTEVAAQCGFENLNYFCRVFRREMGQSAREYRRRSAGGDASPHAVRKAETSR